MKYMKLNILNSKQILKFVLGVEIKKDNLNLRRESIISCGILIFITYILLIPENFFSIIENLIRSSDQPWYVEILAKYSFAMISVKLFFLSLFTKKNNILGRFRAAFATQLGGFVGGIILHILLNSFIKISTTIPEDTKFIYGLLPFVVNLVVFAIMHRIYNQEKFNDKEFFNEN